MIRGWLIAFVTGLAVAGAEGLLQIKTPMAIAHHRGCPRHVVLGPERIHNQYRQPQPRQGAGSAQIPPTPVDVTIKVMTFGSFFFRYNFLLKSLYAQRNEPCNLSTTPRKGAS